MGRAKHIKSTRKSNVWGFHNKHRDMFNDDEHHIYCGLLSCLDLEEVQEK
jgi:hypothetical protein